MRDYNQALHKAAPAHRFLHRQVHRRERLLDLPLLVPTNIAVHQQSVHPQ